VFKILDDTSQVHGFQMHRLEQGDGLWVVDWLETLSAYGSQSSSSHGSGCRWKCGDCKRGYFGWIHLEATDYNDFLVSR
jgi:hypothetical protein